jgi:hypothetical protein
VHLLDFLSKHPQLFIDFPVICFSNLKIVKHQKKEKFHLKYSFGRSVCFYLDTAAQGGLTTSSPPSALRLRPCSGEFH